MTPKAHKVVVLHDGHSPGANGFGVGRAVKLDGIDLVMPDTAAIDIKVPNLDVMTVTFTVFAEVEFRDAPTPKEGVLVRFFGRFYPFRRGEE